MVAARSPRPAGADIATPALLLDLDRFERNLAEDGRPRGGRGQEAPPPRQDAQVPGDRAPPGRGGGGGCSVAKVERGRGDGGGGRPQPP